MALLRPIRQRLGATPIGDVERSRWGTTLEDVLQERQADDMTHAQAQRSAWPSPSCRTAIVLPSGLGIVSSQALAGPSGPIITPR
eukprot:5500267-Pyramimonas_sp.AAC.1